jgi:cell division protein FtsL
MCNILQLFVGVVVCFVHVLQVRDSTHKLERSRESQQNKERECRRLELEVKQQQQKTRDQEREILKLKAIEHGMMFSCFHLLWTRNKVICLTGEFSSQFITPH